MRGIWQDMLNILVLHTCLKITNSILQLYCPWPSGLIISTHNRQSRHVDGISNRMCTGLTFTLCCGYVIIFKQIRATHLPMIFGVVSMPPWQYDNTVQCRYDAIIFLQIGHQSRYGEREGVFGVFNLWWILYFSHHNDVCSVALYWTALYRRLPV